MDGPEQNGDGKTNGAEKRRKYILVIEFDPSADPPTVITGSGDGTPLDVSLAQMMLDEASRQWDAVRRAANAKQLSAQMRQDMQEQQRVAALLHNTPGARRQ
jgi:hypothetical protein